LEKYYEYQQYKKYHEFHYEYYIPEGGSHHNFDQNVSEEFDRKVEDIWHKACVRETEIIEEKKDRIEQLEEQIKQLGEEIKKLRPGSAMSSLGMPDNPDSPRFWELSRQIDGLRDRIKETEMRYTIKFYKQCQSDIGLIFDLCKQYASRFADMEKEWYDENKQLMEEFWLKAGGILKYMTDPDMLELCEVLRELFVVRKVNLKTYFYFPTIPWLSAHDFDEYYYGCISFANSLLLSHGKETVKDYYNLYNWYQEEIEKLQGMLGELIASSSHLQPPAPVDFSGSPVEIEGAALAEYKDPYSQPSQGFTFGGYYYRYNPDGYSWSLPFDDRGKYEYAGDKTTIYERDIVREEMKPLDRRDQKVPVANMAATAYDVAAMAIDASEMAQKARDFGERMAKNVHELDDSLKVGSRFDWVKDAVGKAGDIQGYIGIAQAAANVRTSGNISYSKYVTRDSRGRVLDQGDVYQRQVGGSAHGFGLERTTTVTRSKMTGVATKQKTLTYQYKYGTVTY